MWKCPRYWVLSDCHSRSMKRLVVFSVHIKFKSEWRQRADANCIVLHTAHYTFAQRCERSRGNVSRSGSTRQGKICAEKSRTAKGGLGHVRKDSAFEDRRCIPKLIKWNSKSGALTPCRFLLDSLYLCNNLKVGNLINNALSALWSGVGYPMG